ncbi:MAG: DUF1573 domain-containing protein [Bacteroidetes bacterium]|nr:DUF1573 domain-containing protein [Bacteroidota bacterium]
MKIVNMSITIMLLSFLSLSVGVAQEQPDVQQCFSLDGTTDYYFGEIDQNDTVEHTFVFKNNCSETVEIGQARASCGCTAAVISEKVIPPGGKAEVQVKFTPPRGSRGKVTKTVSLYLKDDDKPHTVIRFSAKIKTDIDIHPPYVQLTGAEVGKEIKGSVTVKNVSGAPLDISSISINMTTYADTAGDGRTIAMPLQGANVTPSKVMLQPDESTEVTVTLTPVHQGQVNGAVRLKTPANEGIIQVFGVVRARQATDLRQSNTQGGVINLDSR